MKIEIAEARNAIYKMSRSFGIMNPVLAGIWNSIDAASERPFCLIERLRLVLQEDADSDPCRVSFVAYRIKWAYV